MRNKTFYFFLLIFFNINILNFSNAEDEFKFNITEIEILENGNLIVGTKKGKAETEDGFEIIAENFIYNKSKNILKVSGNVKFLDTNNNSTIYADKATYLKNEEIIFTEGNSKAIDKNNTITASNFKFDKLKNIIIANKNVEFVDKKKDTRITSDKATYLKNEEIIFTEGNSFAEVENKYFHSENVVYEKINQELSSKKYSEVFDSNNNKYTASNFLYHIDTKVLKANDINLISKVDENKVDNYYFSEGFFNFNKKSFISKDTKINVHKDIFDNPEQDPRIYGSSSRGDNKFTEITKGIFTSCKKNDNCPPWSIQSEKIIHDKINQNLIYKNAILKIYDIPILYFPKFFHPDPTVKRRTGFLQPQFNRSKTLGSSVYIPYFKTLGLDKDYTFKPTIFENKNNKSKIIFQNEYRQEMYNSSLIADFSITRGYKSSTNNKKKDINHLFVAYKKNFKLPNFLKSDLDLKIERVNNDTYLKVFENNLFPSPVMPSSKNLMNTKLNYTLDHDDYSFSTGFHIYEQLGVRHSDRFQYVLPEYDFTKNLSLENVAGTINFKSSGSNNLKNTNNLRSSITNDFHYNSLDYYTNSGLKNNLNIYFKNLNSVGKNDPTYKSSPKVEGMGIFEINSSIPLIKEHNSKKQLLTPKVSFRLNPANNMKDHRNKSNTINANNIFAINRLGVNDSFEQGKSLTLGLDYTLDIEKEKNLDTLDTSTAKSIGFKLATVFRDKYEERIPYKSSINQKSSNIFGSINNNLLENINFQYNFSVDNDLKTFDSHSISSEISINNFITEFSFIENRNKLGNTHLITNKTSYNFDKNNSLSFSTRRNKEISLTEYYDLSYEYKVDCLTAAIKYNRTFYQDDDLVPSENLFLSVTLIPLTTYERKLYERDQYGN